MRVKIGGLLGTYRHAYTHFRVTLHAFHISNTQREELALDHAEVRWVNITQLEDYPMGKIDRMISRDLLGEAGMNGQ